MSFDAGGLPAEALQAAKAIGLLDGNGLPQAGWFESPLAALGSVLRAPEQRAALLALLDAVAPSSPPAGITGDWRPLLSAQPLAGASGNLYLVTSADTNGRLTLGVGADLTGQAGTGPTATLRIALPVVRAESDGATLTAVAGTEDGPLELTARLALGFAMPAQDLTLQALRITARAAPLAAGGAQASLAVTLEGLDLDGHGAHDVALDPQNLGEEAFTVVVALLRHHLAGEAGAAGHLLPLLGLGADPAERLPRFPLSGLTGGLAPLRAWLAALLDDSAGAPPLAAWLSHLAGLFGAPSGGTAAPDPDGDGWRVRLLALGDGDAGLYFRVARRAAADSAAPLAAVGLDVVLAAGSGTPRARLDGRATLVAIPLAGTAAAAVLPDAQLSIIAPGDGTPLVTSAALTVNAARAGARWDGAQVRPLIELDGVSIAGAPPLARVDLADANSVEAAAAAAVQAALQAALGTGAGAHLAALAGLVPPTGATGWTHLVDLAQLVSRPASAIATVHRGALGDGTSWSLLFGDLAALLGLTGPVTGTGTDTDPWTCSLGAAGPVELALAAWNARAPAATDGVQRLRIGVVLRAASAPWNARWLAELAAFDLPATGAGRVGLFGGQHVALGLAPVPAVPPLMGVSLTADAVEARFDWTLGASLSALAQVTNVVVTADGVATTVGTLRFPETSAPAVPDAVARVLTARAAYGWAGMQGFTVAGLLGLHALPGTPTDAPRLGGGASPLLAQPVAALGEWLNTALTAVASDGLPLAPRLGAWLGALLGDALPASPVAVPPDPGTFFPGAGEYDNPWAIAFEEERAVELLLWLEPAGPPVAWATATQAALAAATDWTSWLNALGTATPFLPALRAPLQALTDDAASGLDALAAHLASSDGVVPLRSQLPSAATWTHGATPLTAAHPLQPADPAAISQVLAQLDAWGTGPRAVLLLGPAFSDASTWQPLLTAAEAATPGSTSAGAHFDFRVPGVDPAAVDLGAVTAASYFTADLQDHGLNDLTSLTAQIGRAVDAMRALSGAAAPIFLVAHSTAGVAARVFAAAQPTEVAGLITLGTPHAGALPPPLADARAANAVRLLTALLPAGLGTGPIQDAMSHLVTALNGYLPPVTAGLLPVAAPYPTGDFAGSAGAEAPGVPALALGGALAGKLLELAKAASVALVASAATTGSAPTHLAVGARVRLPLPQTPNGTQVRATVRVGDLRLALRPGVTAPSRPARHVDIRVQLTGDGGWLVGSAGGAIDSPSGPDVRIGTAELGVDLAPSTQGVTATPLVRLTQVAFHSPTIEEVGLDHPSAVALLGALSAQLSAAAPNTAAATLLAVLEALGLAVSDADGVLGLSADGLAALRADAGGFLAPRVAPALDAVGPLLGFSGPAGGPWTFALGDAPLELVVSPAPFAIGLRTALDGPASGPLTLAFDAGLTWPALAGTLDATLGIGNAALIYTPAAGLVLEAPPWIAPLTLFPTTDATAAPAAITRALPPLLLSAVVSSVLETAVGPGVPIGPLAALLVAPGQPFARSGGGLDPAVLVKLANGVASALGAAPATPPAPGAPVTVPLPHDLALSIAGTDTVTLSLGTNSPLGGALDLAFGLDIDRTFAVTPSGSLTLTVATGTTAWPSLAVRFAVDGGGVTLVLTPGAGPPLQLLPTFSGWGALAGDAAALLPVLLDKLVAALPDSALKTGALDVAAAVGAYDSAGGFAAHTDTLRAMATGDFLSGFAGARDPIAAALVSLLGPGGALAGLLPSGGTITQVGSTAVLGLPLPAPGRGTVTATFGWDAAGPAITVGTSGVSFDGGLLVLDVQAGLSGGAPAAAIQLGVDLAAAGLGLAITPALVASASGASGFALAFLPLGPNTGGAPFSTDGPVVLALFPSFALRLGADGPRALLADCLWPLAVSLGIDAFASHLDAALWTAGPTARALLQAAGVIDSASVPLPAPDVTPLLLGLLGALASGADVAITSTLGVRLVNDSGRVGARLHGTLDLPALGSVPARVLFGEPAAFITDSDRGLTVYLADLGTGQLRPAVHAIGLGLGLGAVPGSGAAGGPPLIDTQSFQLGGIDGYLFFSAELAGGALEVTGLGAGVALEALGLPLGVADGTSGNPVAASLLRSSSSSDGDTHPVSPPLGLSIAWRDGTLDARFEGEPGPVWTGVHASFGPLYIEQIGIGLTDVGAAAGGDGLEILVDGGVSIAGLDIAVDQLAVTVPLHHVLSPSHWSLDLGGLAVAFSSSDVTIAGGLVKNPGPPLEYDGMMTVAVAGRSFSAVGSYAQLHDAAGELTSLFVFASLPLTVGGPPFFFVTGMGAGAGYNRAFVPPVNIDDVPTFPLLAAMDDASLANDPARALAAMGTALPPRRGSMWLAAGIRFTSYVIVHSVALAYVQLDHGVEVGLLGTSRMELPTGDSALVNVELALRARYSSADQTLQIRAQLTDHSWLLSRDCQLTGGFALYIWFRDGQFVLTLGGYHPDFQRPASFPDVPRLGFHWSFDQSLVLKGESYFALTNSCVMAGGRLEITYQRGSIRLWFIAKADFLVSWDPFHYDIDVGVEIGAAFTVHICFFGCVTFDVTVSLGASLSLIGPALHGEVTVPLEVASVTVAFGADANAAPPYLQDFELQFAPKYLVGGDPDDTWVGINVTRGLLPPDPPGAQPAPGTPAQPWKVTSEFALSTETRMPASTFEHLLLPDPLTPVAVAGAVTIDLAAMNKSAVRSTHTLRLQHPDGTAAVPRAGTMTIEPIMGLVPEGPWRNVSPEDRTAAANTLRALVGFTITAQAVLDDASALIPFAQLVTDASRAAQPLPFAALDAGTVTNLQALGADGELLAAQVATAETNGSIGAGALAQAVLTQGGAFADNRRRLGAATGLSPVAARAFRTARSAPPLVVPLAAPYTMRPVGLPAPPQIAHLPVDAPIELGHARLRAVVRAPIAHAADAAALAHTTVGRAAVIKPVKPTKATRTATAVVVQPVPRRTPPRATTVVGAKLLRVPSATALRTTRAAIDAPTLRHPELAGALGAAHAALFAGAEAALIEKGVTVASGASHLWDLPSPASRKPMQVIVQGLAAARVTFLGRGGDVLSDQELPPANARVLTRLPVPTTAARMVVGCLGVPATKTNASAGFGTISLVAAPPAERAVAGWQLGGRLLQLDAATLLGRGAVVVLSRAHATRRARQRVHQSLLSAAEVMADQPAVETWLPIDSEVVMLVLDQLDPTAASDGDLGLAVTGAELVTPPSRATGGRRRALFYDVTARDKASLYLTVAVASGGGWRLAGCAGLRGRAAEWAARLAGGVPEHFVPEAPLSAAGAVLIRLEQGDPQ